MIKYNYNDKIECEGEYLNGKKNRKVKEYEYSYGYNGRLKFEGEYSNDEKIKGKEY